MRGSCLAVGDWPVRPSKSKAVRKYNAPFGAFFQNFIEGDPRCHPTGEGLSQAAQFVRQYLQFAPNPVYNTARTASSYVYIQGAP